MFGEKKNDGKGGKRRIGRIGRLSATFLLGLALSLIVGMAFAQPAMAAVTVSNETALRSAVAAVTPGVPTTIELTDDITLTGSALTIPAGTDITLTSDTGFRELVGAGGQRVVAVNGRLTMGLSGTDDTGLILTHGAINKWGGVSVAAGGTFIMNAGAITGNSATWGGGVLSDGTFKMYGGTIAGNDSPDWCGGGVAIIGGGFELSGGEIKDNSADYLGGGIYVENGTLVVLGGEIFGNTAEHGGGIYLESNANNFTLEGGKIHDNSALIKGGGIFSNTLEFTLKAGEIFSNNAEHGAGIYLGDLVSTATIKGGEIYLNTADDGHGGGVFCSAGAFVMQEGEISGNDAKHGGGLYVSSATSLVTLEGGKISANAASEKGGGVYTDATSVALSGAEIFGNTAQYGGGIYTDNSVLTLTSGLIAHNEAALNGGGVFSHNLANVQVGEAMHFSGNSAVAAFDRDPADDALYLANILGTVWTAPFTQGYNNFDIYYVREGVEVPRFTVTFSPGAHGAFAAVSYTDILRGLPTPAAPATPGATGWVFAGWDRVVSSTVTGDVTYVAQWKQAGDTDTGQGGGTTLPKDPEKPSTMPPTGEILRFMTPMLLLLAGVATAVVVMVQRSRKTNLSEAQHSEVLRNEAQ